MKLFTRLALHNNFLQDLSSLLVVFDYIPTTTCSWLSTSAVARFCTPSGCIGTIEFIEGQLPLTWYPLSDLRLTLASTLIDCLLRIHPTPNLPNCAGLFMGKCEGVLLFSLPRHRPSWDRIDLTLAIGWSTWSAHGVCRSPLTGFNPGFMSLPSSSALRASSFWPRFYFDGYCGVQPQYYPNLFFFIKLRWRNLYSVAPTLYLPSLRRCSAPPA